MDFDDVISQTQGTIPRLHKTYTTDECQESNSALLEGSRILNRQYQIVRLLYQRPRLNLYIGRRLSHHHPHSTHHDDDPETLVAIRELVLTDFSPEMRGQVEQAAFEEFVSPSVLSSPRLPGGVDRVRIEDGRHYLIMQLHRGREKHHSVTVTLEDLLLSRRKWPHWLDVEAALGWGIQLCRTVARLHHLGVVLADLNLNTILVDQEGTAEWSPVLLASWPPAPQFWPSATRGLLRTATDQYQRTFPLASPSPDDPFIASERFKGTCDERSDVYSLGAILYLLLTTYAPATALRRQRATCTQVHEEKRRTQISPAVTYSMLNTEGMALIPPHLLNEQISSALEHVIVRALSVNPAERYQSVFALTEALEFLETKGNFMETSHHQASKGRKVIEWLRGEAGPTTS